MRDSADPKSPPIEGETYNTLVALLEQRYPKRVRRVVEVTPKAVTKHIDNEYDAQETIFNLRQALIHDPIGVAPAPQENPK